MVPTLQDDVRRFVIAPAKTVTAGLAVLSTLSPHEWLCGLFFVTIWVQLVQAVGFYARDTLLILFLLTVNAAALGLGASQENEFHSRLRFLFYPIAMNLVYFILATAVPAIHPRLEDDALQRIDAWLIGTNLSLRMEPWIHPVLTEGLSFCYLWYLFYLFSSQARYFCTDLKLLKKFYTGLFSIYGIGFIGYSTVPALGPHLSMADQFSVPLEGWWFTALTSEIVLLASNRVDIFPSLHVANSLYILLFDYRHKRRRFWLCLVPCLGLFLSTIYLRYHYFIDVLCGLGLSLLALQLANQDKARKEHRRGI
jgi:membrane-associated phospholipid phosphatase